MTDHHLPAPQQPDWRLESGAYETAAVGGPAPDFDAFLATFEAFRQANDARLAEIEKNGAADVLLEEKVDRINDALDHQQRAVDELALSAGRPDIETGGPLPDSPARERKALWEGYMRYGSIPAGSALSVKALSAGTDASGGYLVPEEIDRQVGRLLQDSSTMRSLATVRRINSGTFSKPVVTTGATASWKGETADRTETTQPTLSEVEIATHDLYAMPAATQTLLDDAAIDVGAWLAEEIRISFAEKENDAFLNGTGSGQPKGIFRVTTVANASWRWDRLGYIASGKAGGFASSNPVEPLLDLVYSLKPGYRSNARWIANRKTLSALRKIKDSNDGYIWQPAESAGTQSSLLNFPIAEMEDAPNLGSGSFSIAFGDFRRGYLIVDRVGLRVLRDPYSDKPHVRFYATRRVGGDVQDFDAIKLMKFSTS